MFCGLRYISFSLFAKLDLSLVKVKNSGVIMINKK